MVFHKKSCTFDVLFGNKDEILSLKRLTVEVCRITTEARHFLKEERKNFRRERVMEKHTHDYMSYVGKEFEVRLAKALFVLLPEAGFITEKGSAIYQGKPCCWVVDPLDGATNYIHDEVPYRVCIALCSRTELPLGVVYEVCRNERFYTWKEGKTFMGGEEIHVLDVQDTKNTFMFTELPYNYNQYRSTVLHLIDNPYRAVRSTRMNDSVTIAICYIANGRFGAWVETFIGKWDRWAAALTTLEAGGRVTDFYGDDHLIEGHHITATNRYLHSSFLKLLTEVPPLDT